MANPSAPNFQAKFDEAVQLLSQKKTLEGAEVLRELRNQGNTSAGLEANLGRAFVELGDLGQGIPLLTNAVALERTSDDLRSNLSFAQKKVDAGWGTPMAHPAEWASRISSYLRPQEILSVASLLLLVLVWMAALKKIRRMPALVWLIVSVATFALGIFAYSGQSIAVVTKKESLKNAPLESAEELMPISPGVRLRILRTSGDFIEVERPNNFRGWIGKNSVTRNPF